MRVAVRSWLIRGLILAGVAVLAALGWVANSWVSPERVREQVIAHLNEQFDGVDVHVGSARMRILGGIAVGDLRLVRRGAPPDQPFLVVPAAVLYHDKEQLNRGRLVIKKVELENPQLHLERSPAGVWNVSELLRPGPADRPVPTFVARGAVVTVTDHVPGGLPPLRFTDARVTLLNDPLPVLILHAQATAEGYGPAEIRARLNRVTRYASVGVDLPAFPLGPVAAAVAERFAPDLAPHVAKLTAAAAVKADLTYAPDATPAWRHDVRVDVKDGRFDHPDLPWPVEKIAVKVRSVDGRVKVEEATAKIGNAALKLALETRHDSTVRGPTPAPLPLTGSATGGIGSDPDAFARLEEHVQRAEATVTGVALDDALFARLGDLGAKLKRMFAPTGTVEVGYKFTREAAGWRREFEVRPQSAGVTYERFKYPVADVLGSVRRTVTHAGAETTLVDLRGKATGQTVTVKGQLTGNGPDPGVNLRIAGTNVPLDEAIIAALPGKFPPLVRQFRATGRADFVAEIVQQPGVNLSDNEFRVELHDGTLNYTQFPYLLRKVKGRMVVRVASTDPTRPVRPGEPLRELPDSDELTLDGFTGTHGGATVWLHGSKRPITGSANKKLLLHIGGSGCGVDDDLKAALGGVKLDGVWGTFAPRGTLTFAADVEVIDRPASPGRPQDETAFNPATDLKLTFNFSGPTVIPAFFPYEMTDLSGWLEYKNGRLDLAHFAGRHGEARLKLAAGEVRFYPDGAVWANLGGVDVKPFVADAALVKAFPGKLRAAFEELKLRGGAELSLKHLVVLTPPDAAPGAAMPPPEPLPVGPAAVNPVSPLRSNGVWPPLAPSSLLGKGVGGFGSARPIARGQAAASPPPDPVVYWDAELKLAGAALDTGVAWDDLFGAVACRGRYEGTHLGLVRGNIWLDRATVARQPVTGIKGHARATAQRPDPARPGQYLPIELEFADLSADLFHGAVGGEARVVVAEPVRYELWLAATDVQLEEVARHYKLGTDADLKGVAQAQLRLFNRPDPKTGTWATEGTGKIDVPAGRMYNLPVLLDLVKVLKLQAPDKTAFEEAHAVFRVQGDRIKVDQLDLIGKAVCVGGSGELDATGEYVRFEFYTLGSQILARLVNTPVGDLTAFLSKNLFQIRMTREGGELKYRPEPIPVVTDPIRAVMDRLKIRAGRPAAK